MDRSQPPLIFAGSSHPTLAQEIARHLGVELGRVTLDTFPDGETFVRVEENVRGRDVFVFQSVARDPNHHLMELLILVDALKRASAESINVVMPYYGYARQDRREEGRESITARLVADLLERAGATRLLTMDLHAAQIQGFFDRPVDNLCGKSVVVQRLKEVVGKDAVAACPDIGSVKIARGYADALQVPLAIVDKQRLSADEVAVTTVIGDVEGKEVILCDDMCATAGTLVAAAEAVKGRGATKVIAAVTHGLFVGEALERLQKSAIDHLLVTNTVPDQPKMDRIEVISVADHFGEAIERIRLGKTISRLSE